MGDATCWSLASSTDSLLLHLLLQTQSEAEQSGWKLRPVHFASGLAVVAEPLPSRELTLDHGQLSAARRRLGGGCSGISLGIL